MIKVKLGGRTLQLEAAEGYVSLYDAEEDDVVWEADLSYSDEIEQGIADLMDKVRKEKTSS